MNSVDDNVELAAQSAKNFPSRDALLLALQQQIALNSELQSQVALHAEKIEILQEQLRLAIAQRFGKSSEKTDPNQRELFNEAEWLAEQPEPELDAEAPDEDAPANKKKKGRKGLNPDLPRERIEHPLSEEERAGAVDTFWTKVKEELHIDPARACVREIWQEKAVFETDGERQIVAAQRPKHPLGKCIASVELLAWIIVAKYADYGVDRWRKAFEAIAAQLDEIKGEHGRVVDTEDRQQAQGGLAATEPGFEFLVEAKKIRIDFQNLTEVRVNYYLMDIELLFSRNPFVQQYSGQFSTIRPNLSRLVDLPQDKAKIEFDLPEELRSSNVLVEVTGAGKTRSQAYYANSLAVQIVENYGQVRVTHQATRKPLSKVYVKVYARTTDGRVRFYKDGYTDLRGRFDFTSLNTNELDSVQRFALLIYSNDHGAVVREASPPKR